MALPAGITTCTVTIGTGGSFLGEDAVISGSVIADRDVVWSATGSALYNVESAVTPSMAGGQASFAVPHVDQAGFVDASGNGVTNWYYVFNGRATFDGNRVKNITKRFQVKVGQTLVDLDLIPDGPVTPGVTVPAQYVTSVNGQTGAVELEVGGGGGGGSSTVTVTDGGLAPLGNKLEKVGVIIDLGAPGGYDESLVEGLVVQYDPEVGRYAGVYVGYGKGPSGLDANFSGSAMLTYSDDGIHWEPGVRLLGGSGGGTAPDRGGITGPTLVRANGLWHMFYIGLTSAGSYEGGVKTLCLATSPSLISPTWTRRGTLLSGSKVGDPANAAWRQGDAVWHPNVIQVGEQWFCFINVSGLPDNHERIGVASADNLLGPWTWLDDISPVIPDQPPYTITGDPCVTKVPGGWRMDFYRAVPGSTSANFYATTTDALFPAGWVVQNGGKAILEPGQFYDGKFVKGSWITRIAGRLFHYYSAGQVNIESTEGKRAIALAVDPPLTAKPNLLGLPPIKGQTDTAKLQSVIDLLVSLGIEFNPVTVGTPVIADTFNRADSGTLGTTTTGGKTWTTGSGFAISGNKATYTGSVDGNSYVASGLTGGESYEVSVQITFADATIDYAGGLILYGDQVDRAVRFIVTRDAPFIYASNQTPGVTVSTYYPTARRFVSGDVLKCRCVGDEVTVLFNDDLILKHVSSVADYIRNGGMIGMASAAGRFAQYDNFKVSPIT